MAFWYFGHLCGTLMDICVASFWSFLWHSFGHLCGDLLVICVAIFWSFVWHHLGHLCGALGGGPPPIAHRCCRPSGLVTASGSVDWTPAWTGARQVHPKVGLERYVTLWHHACESDTATPSMALQSTQRCQMTTRGMLVDPLASPNFYP